MQMSSPMLLALQDYLKEAEANIGKMFGDPGAYKKLRAAAPLDPNTKYLVPENNKIVRVKLQNHCSDGKTLTRCGGDDLKNVSLHAFKCFGHSCAKSEILSG